MNPALLPLLQCPATKAPLKLVEAEVEPTGVITSGWLVSTADAHHRYPVIRGIPRFTRNVPQLMESVAAFADQWTYFGYERFREHFEKNTIANTFGTLEEVRGKLIVDAGAGSGLQTRWLAQSGAAHVVALELSGLVDGIISKNLQGLPNADIIQCSIDAVPLRNDAIPGIVMCRNAIQHTPSVAETLKELWRITAPGGECVWNCYIRKDATPFQRKAFAASQGVRNFVASLPFSFRLAHAHVMAALGLVPVLNAFLEKTQLVVMEEPPPTAIGWQGIKQRYASALLGTFDFYGAHTHQHHHTMAQLQGMISLLRPVGRMLNAAAFFAAEQPPGILLRLKK